MWRNTTIGLPSSLVEAIHDADAFVRLNICGNIAHLLPGIARLGVDILDVDRMAQLARSPPALPPRI